MNFNTDDWPATICIRSNPTRHEIFNIVVQEIERIDTRILPVEHLKNVLDYDLQLLRILIIFLVKKQTLYNLYLYTRLLTCQCSYWYWVTDSLSWCSQIDL